MVKAAAAPDEMSATNIKLMKAFLKNCNAQPDFKAIATEAGVKNAPRDLKAALAKWDLVWKDGEISDKDDTDNAAGPANPTGPKRKRGKANDDDGETKAATTKKAKKTAAKVDKDDGTTEEDAGETKVKTTKKTKKAAAKVEKDEAATEDDDEVEGDEDSSSA